MFKYIFRKNKLLDQQYSQNVSNAERTFLEKFLNFFFSGLASFLQKYKKNYFFKKYNSILSLGQESPMSQNIRVFS